MKRTLAHFDVNNASQSGDVMNVKYECSLLHLIYNI